MHVPGPSYSRGDTRNSLIFFQSRRPFGGVFARTFCLQDPYKWGAKRIKKSSSEHQRMLGITRVNPVAEQDTDLSDPAPEIVPVTQSELGFKHNALPQALHDSASSARPSVHHLSFHHRAHPEHASVAKPTPASSVTSTHPLPPAEELAAAGSQNRDKASFTTQTAWFESRATPLDA